LADPDPRVRFHAATPLARAGDKKAVAALIPLLAGKSEAVAQRVEDLLYRIAGDKAPEIILGTTAEERRKGRDAWAAWWKANEAKVDLARLNLKKLLRGITVVCECGEGKHPQGYVWGYRAGGKPLFEFDNVNTPCDVQLLPNNHVLVATYHANEVTERDRKGKVLWTFKVPGQARSCQRLPNGNTFVASSTAVMEVTRAGKVLYTYQKPEGIFRAYKLRNGRIVYVSNRGRVVLLDAKGKEIKSVNVPGGVQSWGDVQLLPNGRFLVCSYSGNKVQEITAAGKAVWEVTVTSPSSVNRLPNGNTLVTSMNAKCVVEYNRAGKEVSKQVTPGRPFCVRRY
jgi:outer membrane protein assembly factor BamB